MMQTYPVLFLLFAILPFEMNSASQTHNKLSRQRRYLSFPEGSTISVAICMVAQIPLHPKDIFTEAVNWGISYELPNINETLDYLHPYYAVKRRNRRAFYNKLEIIMNSMGYNGRDCIFRTLCEAGSLFMKRGSVFEEIFKTLFRFPLEEILESEPVEHRLYQWAHQVGKEKGSQGCSETFPACSFSLLDLALSGFGSYLQRPEFT